MLGYSWGKLTLVNIFFDTNGAFDKKEVLKLLSFIFKLGSFDIEITKFT